MKGVIGVFEEQQRKINIKLEAVTYDMAIKAHEKGIPISCIGELQKNGNIYGYFRNFVKSMPIRLKNL